MRKTRRLWWWSWPVRQKRTRPWFLFRHPIIHYCSTTPLPPLPLFFPCSSPPPAPTVSTSPSPFPPRPSQSSWKPVRVPPSFAFPFLSPSPSPCPSSSGVAGVWKPWDWAAGVLIAKEAGAVILAGDGGQFRLMGDTILGAATPELASSLTSQLNAL